MEAVVRVRFPIRPVLAVAVAGLVIAGGSAAMTLGNPVRDAAVAVPQFRPPAAAPTVPTTAAAPTTTATPTPTPSAKPKKRPPTKRPTAPRTTTAKPAPTTKAIPAPRPATPQRLSARAGDVGARVRAQVRAGSRSKSGSGSGQPAQAAQPQAKKVQAPRPLQQILRRLVSALGG